MNIYAKFTWKTYVTMRRACMHAFRRKSIGEMAQSTRASPNGTNAFVKKHKLPLYHKFAISNLLVNPIIHGPPQLKSLKSQIHSDAWFEKAISNGVNCLYVYNRFNNDEVWFASNCMSSLAMSGFGRECFVLVAGIGKPAKATEIVQRLESAVELSSIGALDYVIFEVDYCCHLNMYTSF